MRDSSYVYSFSPLPDGLARFPGYYYLQAYTEDAIMKRIENVERWLKKLCAKQYKELGEVTGIAAVDIAQKLGIHRSNVSSDLNTLFREGKITKVAGKPVFYSVKELDIKECASMNYENDSLSGIIGAELSLKNAVQQARAAIMYPPKGLHTLLYGETGTGKSMFAGTMYEYAKEIGKIRSNAPFIVFNCADYANNPELLMAQLFGVKKGAYTGADKDRIGIVEKAHEGVLFLDEVHRLPPEGQEMLFYLIDKGVYRKLGEPALENKAEILIICATTENIESVLLKTFTRRIPMLIKLPALKERTIEERYELVKYCFRMEAFCIKEDITVTANCIKALLLYDCVNNIGQLESDIKLCSAKAFLDSRMKKGERIVVHSEDLPQYVVKGLFKYKEHKIEIDKFLHQDSIIFSIDESNKEDYEVTQIFNFYEALEEKRKTLELKGINEKDIGLIMSLDIDIYFKKYMLHINKQDLEELYKVVDRKIVYMVDEFLNDAKSRLKQQLDPKILYGLSMHVAKSVERINSGNKIENHQLQDIKKSYPFEFQIAQALGRKIETELGICIPEDEIGFITMFLCMDKAEEQNRGRAGVIVAMHGESAATSIADVANRLLGNSHAVGYNMPLDQKTDIALDHLIKLVKEVDEGKGVVLLVDMGSLVLMGDMIYERTNIPVKTMEMVSTPMVIEATRKALLNGSLEEIHEACMNLSPFVGRIYRDSGLGLGEIKNNIIITACITGQGTAVKLKSIIQQHLEPNHSDIDVLPIEVSTKQVFNKNIQRIKSQKNILAVVSSIEHEDQAILYIPMSEIFKKGGMGWINRQLTMLKSINNMEKVIAENVQIDANTYIECVRRFYIALLKVNIELHDNTLIGLILHLAYVVERVLKGEQLLPITGSNKIRENNLTKVNFIKKELAPMEAAFKIDISLDECVNLVKMIYLI
jgi:transcriptional regulator with AAA-type ATPase domain/transcriptional regulatory protein LevR